MRALQTPALAEAAASPAVTLRRMRIEMGTTLVIEARADSHPQAAAAIDTAFAAVSDIAARLSPHAADSDLRRIGAAAPGTAVPVSPATFEVLCFAQRLNAMSERIFDPCLPSRPGRIGDLELTFESVPRVTARAALEIDCGGIAKGYAVDAAIEALRRAGCSAGLVNAGGDLRTFGERSEPLLLRGVDGGLRQVTLENAAVAVSHRDASRAPPGHRGYYVRSGDAATRRYAAVRAPEAMVADALTKCLLLAPAALCRTLLTELHGASLAELR
jgi:FAD:protein FMN transferase